MNTAPSFPDHNAYFTPAVAAAHTAAASSYAPPERSYTLGGDGYGSNTIPDPSGHAGLYSTAPYPSHTSPAPISPVSHSPSPAPINTAAAGAGPSQSQSPTNPKGPRPPAPAEQPIYEDSPPMYDAATAQPPGQWGAKH